MKKLTLRRDTLGELSSDELTNVVGGVSGALCLSGLLCVSGSLCAPTQALCLTELCPTWDCTGCYPTCGC